MIPQLACCADDLMSMVVEKASTLRREEARKAVPSSTITSLARYQQMKAHQTQTLTLTLTPDPDPDPDPDPNANPNPNPNSNPSPMP